MLKALFVFIVSVACLFAALILMPWSELNFGTNLNAIPDWSHGFVGQLGGLKDLGQWAQSYLSHNGSESPPGDYMYALVIFGILTLLGIVFAAVGREDTAEKMYLPVKK